MQRRKNGFATRIKKALANGNHQTTITARIEKLIAELVDELDCEGFAAEMTADRYTAGIAEFDDLLNTYGPERKATTYDKYAIVESLSPYKSYRVVWHAQYDVFLSVMMRLEANHHIELTHVSIKHNQHSIHMIPGHSLKLAWINERGGPSGAAKLPLLVYCARRLAAQDESILSLINDKKITIQQRLEIGEALCKYHASLSPFDYREVGEVLIKLMRQFLTLDQMMTLPDYPLTKAFIPSCDAKELQQYVTKHNRPDELMLVLKKSTQDEGANSIMRLHEARVRRISSFSLLELVASAGNIKAAALLLASQRNNALGRALCTKAFHSALESGQVEMVRLLLQRGVNVNANFPDGESPLMKVVRSHDVGMVLLLLECGAQTNNCHAIASELNLDIMLSLLNVQQLYLAIDFDVPYRHEAFKNLRKAICHQASDDENIVDLFSVLNDYLTFVQHFEGSGTYNEKALSHVAVILEQTYKMYSQNGQMDKHLLAELVRKSNSLIRAIQRGERSGKLLAIGMFDRSGDSEEVIKLRNMVASLEIYIKRDEMKLRAESGMESPVKRSRYRKGI